MQMHEHKLAACACKVWCCANQLAFLRVLILLLCALLVLLLLLKQHFVTLATVMLPRLFIIFVLAAVRIWQHWHNM